MKHEEERTEQLSLSEIEQLRIEEQPATEEDRPTERAPQVALRSPHERKHPHSILSKLGSDQQLAAASAVGLAISLALPWYHKTYSAVVNEKLQQASDSISAFAVFSFIEAAVLLVSIGVVVLLLARVEHRRFHLPGGDGTVIMGAGIWAGLLIAIRMFDRPNATAGQQGVNVGIEWGIFVALVAAAALAYAGFRMREGSSTGL